MGIEAKLAEIKGKELSKFPEETRANSITNSNTRRNRTSSKSNQKGKKNKRRQKKMAVSPVQRLYDTCKEVFASCGAGIVPSPEDIERLQTVLDEIKPKDVGLTPGMPDFCAVGTGRTPPITYQHIFECDKFSMGIFCLPPSGVIPLHDHPEMTVFSKLLFGTMHIKSYDWVGDGPCNTSAVMGSSQTQSQQPEVRLAKVKVNSNFTAPCKTSILFPADGGNMHCFTAVTACAVLDVLGPPYDDLRGRPCTYYREFPFSKFSVDGVSVPEADKDVHGWLQERKGKLEDLVVTGATYRGPAIVEN
ncbi:hypothetical protein SLEP1_g20282 [Rubroshorea leprosula]|uniref:cysteine dioxygenase n=2 Tax=Rubroshorea leprosula TaxID=152421 RepID=A0AAV5JCN9_9ROSI|nr:hypothetical protein SLEP1_g20282 [Rubroshorea leprosula]